MAACSACLVPAAGCGSPSRPAGARGGGGPGLRFDPLSYRADRAPDLVDAAAAGLAHVIYAKSPGGALASAQRTARFRDDVERAARPGPLDADTLEAIVVLESAGRPDVIAGSDPRAAAGLTQILAETASHLLALRVNLAASRRVATQIAAAQAAGNSALASRLRTRRAAIDQRFDPVAALAATERYLALAKRRFGRDDLAVASYHMGIGNLETALRRYAGVGAGGPPIDRLVADGSLSYAKLYFDSTPLSHASAYAWLARLGDDSATYLWRVEAAKRLMRQFRADPAEVRRQETLQTAAPSAERVLRPPGTPGFADPGAVAQARRDARLVAPPASAAPELRGGAAVLRPDALAAALYIASGVHAIAHRPTPLELTSATVDRGHLASTAKGSGGQADGDPLHATGYAFDIARRYATPAQGQAFQFMLDRLQVLNLIAWVRDPRIIHVVAGPSTGGLRGIVVGR